VQGVGSCICIVDFPAPCTPGPAHDQTAASVTGRWQGSDVTVPTKCSLPHHVILGGGRPRVAPLGSARCPPGAACPRSRCGPSTVRLAVLRPCTGPGMAPTDKGVHPCTPTRHGRAENPFRSRAGEPLQESRAREPFRSRAEDPFRSSGRRPLQETGLAMRSSTVQVGRSCAPALPHAWHARQGGSVLASRPREAPSSCDSSEVEMGEAGQSRAKEGHKRLGKAGSSGVVTVS